MVAAYLKVIMFLFMNMLLFATESYAQVEAAERHTIVAMRMIGHEILLSSGDSTSLILPIEKKIDRYRIQFESDFQFNPGELVTTIDSVVRETRIANSYLVEVENCETNQVIYSYEIGNSAKLDLIPCAKRMQPSACYSLLFTILDANQPITSLDTRPPGLAKGSPYGSYNIDYITIVAQLIAFLLLIGLVAYFLKKKRKPVTDPNLISIGKYQLDQKNMELSFEDNKIGLTSKETDLLSLLHSFANDTLEREVILKTVWGDEGGYVGRTLDVFISKLRKKLGSDSSVKIVNIRGQGYKLVTNIQH